MPTKTVVNTELKGIFAKGTRGLQQSPKTIQAAKKKLNSLEDVQSVKVRVWLG